MKRSQILAFLLLISCQVLGQELSFYKFGSYREISDVPTDHIRIVEKSQYQVIVKDYYRDSLNLRVKISPLPEQDDILPFMVYLRSKLLDMDYQPAFASSKAYLQFYKKGEIKEEMIYKNRQFYFYKVIDNDGNQVLDATGSGSMITQRKDEVDYRIFKDSLETHHFTVRAVEGDTLYVKMDKIATPKGGYPEFTRKLNSILKYPISSRMNGQEGTVIVQFTVDKEGVLSEFEFINNQPAKIFENEVLRKLSRLKYWDPAEFQGEKVKSCYRIPFTFKLKDQ